MEEEIAHVDELRVRKEALDFVQNVKQVFVTFKTMEAKNLAVKIFYQRAWNDMFSKHKQLELRELKLEGVGMHKEEADEENKPEEGEENNSKDELDKQKPYGSLFIVENANPE